MGSDVAGLGMQVVSSLAELIISGYAKGQDTNLPAGKLSEKGLGQWGGALAQRGAAFLGVIEKHEGRILAAAYIGRIASVQKIQKGSVEGDAGSLTIRFEPEANLILVTLEGLTEPKVGGGAVNDLFLNRLQTLYSMAGNGEGVTAYSGTSRSAQIWQRSEIGLYLFQLGALESLEKTIKSSI